MEYEMKSASKLAKIRIRDKQFGTFRRKKKN